ncbi:MAG: LysM peptidoglycan-binding domain-containing protein [Ruminococcaceae bacterium]|nr:LysM peptidoglycan-binding domain-containing protein [Oscillospiraceae bacterium]
MIAIKKIYKVSEGDTLWGIAKKYLGRVSRYTEIVRLNKLQTAYLTEGQLLVLPVA